jgi:hypothetical protein
MTAVVPFNRVKFTAATGGTGAFVFGALIIGFRSPVGLIPDGTPVSVTAQSPDTTQWETVHGAWHSASSSISRDLVFENSAGTGIAQGGNGSPLNFTVPPTVLIDYLAQDVSLIPSGGNLTFYVATTGSDSNSGASTTTPFATLQHAMNVAAGYRYSGATLTLQMADGTYANQNGIGMPLTDAGRINIYGNNSSPGNVKFTDPNGNGILYVGSPGIAQTNFYVQGITFDSTYQGIGNYSGFLRFGNCQFEDSISGSIIAVGTYNFGFSQCPFGNGFHITILSNFYELFQVELGYIELQGGDTTLTLPANASVGFCTVELNNDATCSWGFATVTNGSTLSGQAIRLASNCHSGNVAVNGGGANGIPGNGGVGLYDETCTLIVGGTSTKGGHFYWNKSGQAVAADIAPLTYSIYKDSGAGVHYIALNDGNSIFQAPIPGVAPGSTLTTANLTFYVSTTGSDSNPGTSALPFATIQKAVNVGGSYNYGGVYTLTINVGAGTFSIPNTLLLPELVNYPVGTPANINGAGASSTIIFDSNANGLALAAGKLSFWNLANMTLDSSRYQIDAEFGSTITTNIFNPGSDAIIVADRNNNGTEVFNSFHGGSVITHGSTTVITTAFSAFYLGGGLDASFTFGGSLTLPSGSYGSGHYFLNTNTNGSTFIDWDPSSVTNGGSWTGNQIAFGGGSPTNLQTPDGTLSGIPGIATGNIFDATSQIGPAFSNQQYLWQPKSGSPTTSDLPNNKSWSVFKDTSGGELGVVANDGGTVRHIPFPNVPSTQTGNYAQTTADTSIIFNGTGTITLSLLSAASYPARELKVRTIANQSVVSASSNVVPLAGGAAGTAILPATAGKWALLVSDGTNWQIMESN